MIREQFSIPVRASFVVKVVNNRPVLQYEVGEFSFSCLKLQSNIQVGKTAVPFSQSYTIWKE